MIRLVAFSILFFAGFFSFAQQQKPKLVVGIVIDQMRYDYLDRYWNKFSDDGFKKIVNGGFNCKNTHYNYMPTYTGPGHASIYTGTTPENHGIIANDWYNKKTKKMIYCAEDTTVKTIGSSSKEGLMSPKNMVTTTITDQLKLNTNFKGKVIGVSLKDRGAILPAGHKADAAYWFEGKNTGKWISSSYYLNELPKWVQEVNKKNSANTYLSKPWNTLLPIADYSESIADNNPYEGVFKGEKTPTFPHNLPALRDSNENYSLIKNTPFGNNITTEMALAAIVGENLGDDLFTDFLAVSYSSPDYIGHQYGPMSVEVQDNYLRLDQDIAQLLTFLESKFGKDEVLIFITADHGAVDVPQFLMDNHIPAGYFDKKKMVADLKTFCLTKWNADLIENISNGNVFLNHETIAKYNLNTAQIEQELANFLLSFEGVSQTFTATTLKTTVITENIAANIQRGFNQVRSGDVVYVLASGWINAGYSTGTTHGSPYHYDTHVPLIWYGNQISAGETTKKVVIPDIAATLAVLLNINAPSACTGNPIKDLIK
ncbi:MAG: alkaline phosphatase family protein [Flavobacteriales bacterium]|nr:MAG: alkaline phosphatase family protein [Flavobacteriales bacterium]